MKKYNIDGVKYYFADELRKEHPKVFRGCNNTRTFIEKKEVPEEKYTYARKDNKGKWEESDGSSRKFDKIFISVKWFEDEYVNKKKEVKVEEEEEEYDIQDAPEIIELEDKEKFIDNFGNIVEIEVRGKRKIDECYFKVKDIAEGFQLPNLHSNIIKKKSGFELGEHYVYFNFSKANSQQDKIKKLFLTYYGLLRVLFASQKKTVKKFVNWAAEVLFTIQMGTPAQKNKLVANVLGVSTEAVKEVLNKTSNQVSCNYLFSIGRVRNLREALDISKKYNDDDFVYKWGMTKDLERRIAELIGEYNMKGTKVELVIYNYTDPQYISEAETALKHMMQGYGLNLIHETHKELAIIPKEKMGLVKKQYETIAKAYRGQVSDMIAQLKEKEFMIKEKDAQLKIMQLEKDSIIKDKDAQLKMMQQECDNKIAQRDIEYWKNQAEQANKKLKKKR